MRGVVMNLIIWDKTYATGIASVDQEHQQLINLINRLHNAMLGGTAYAEMERYLDEMIEYTRFHFETEEELMRAEGYPELESHRKQHSAFIVRTEEFADRLKNQKVGLSIAVFSYLKDWLTSHILDVDHRMVPHMRGRGVR